MATQQGHVTELRSLIGRMDMKSFGTTTVMDQASFEATIDISSVISVG